MNRTSFLTHLSVVVALTCGGCGGEQCEDKIAAFVTSQDFVKQELRSPSTAKFPYYNDRGVTMTYVGECTHEIEGFVDAQNAFGTPIRHRYSVKVQNTRGTTTWTRIGQVRILDNP